MIDKVALQVKYRDIDSLIPYAKNSRTHNDEQVAQIAASIKEFGWTNPVLVDGENGIIAGHGRVLAARKLGFTEVPTIELAHLSDTQRRAYIIADNRLAEMAGWDGDMLKLEIEDLKLQGFDLDLTGFNDAALNLMSPLDQADTTSGDTEPQLDKIEELREKWDVQVGQLWALGDHRLLCGDSCDLQNVLKVMDGESADICFTSPPYNRQRNYRNDAPSYSDDWDTLMCGVFSSIQMSYTGQILVNLGMIHEDGEWVPYWNKWLDWMRDQGWKRFAWYVWDQGPGMPGNANGRLAPSHEFIWHFCKNPVQPTKARACAHANQQHSGKGQRGKDGVVKDRSAKHAIIQPTAIYDSVFRVNRQGSAAHAAGHPAPYPVGLPTIALESWPGIVYEPFSGSGTTIIACENLGRKCRAIELSPGYVAVAIQRWADHTGKTPKLI